MNKKERRAKLHLQCRVLSYNFGRKGAIDGLIVEINGERAQVVCDAKMGRRLSMLVSEGGEADLTVTPAPLKKKGPAEHPVYFLDGLPEDHTQSSETEVSGAIVRFNYSKHGEANGVVLESGDFVHVKPSAMRRLTLEMRETVSAKGRSRAMEVGGHVLEAVTINGIELHGKKTHRGTKSETEETTVLEIE